MKKANRYILCAWWLLFASFALTAQSPATEPQSAPTPPAKTLAKPASSPELTLEMGADYESLSNNRSDWQTYFFRFNRKFSSGQNLYGEASLVRRFDSSDPNFMIGFYQPLGESRRWSATFEVAGSPTHDVMPAVSLYGQLERNFGNGWLGHAGVRQSHYSDDDVTIGVFGVEKYIKAYRGAYTLYVAHLDGRRTSTSHAFQGNYYYGERNSVGVGFAFGEEIESIGNGRFIRTDVRELSLTGRHWFSERWGLSYVALWHRQGVAYARSAAQGGLLLRF